MAVNITLHGSSIEGEAVLSGEIKEFTHSLNINLPSFIKLTCNYQTS